MERVAFLIEATGERLGCLLNPDNLVVRRSAGVRSRATAGGRLSGVGLADDPLLYTGGGRTELLVDLLFDVQIAGSTIQTDDVRDLTRPLWRLAENARDDEGFRQPPLVRFVWGKAWNVPGIVAAIAERLEQFTPAGAPMRSWLRMRLLRVGEEEAQSQEAPIDRGLMAPDPDGPSIPEEQVTMHRMLGGGTAGGTGGPTARGERLEDIAFTHYGDPSAWRIIAAFNEIQDPARVPPGTVLRLPPASALGARQ